MEDDPVCLRTRDNCEVKQNDAPLLADSRALVNDPLNITSCLASSQSSFLIFRSTSSILICNLQRHFETTLWCNDHRLRLVVMVSRDHTIQPPLLLFSLPLPRKAHLQPTCTHITSTFYIASGWLFLLFIYPPPVLEATGNVRRCPPHCQ